jgi:molybdenum cofactor cytidylyltransferase
MTFALIPAAGKSTRMGRPKLLLPLGGRTVLEHVVTALRAGGVEEVLVVVGPHVAQLAEVAASAGARVLALTEETADMRATVEAGLEWLDKHRHPSPDDHWLLVPADHPTLEPDIVRRLLATARQLPPGQIVVPTHGGRRGHPTLVGWRHREGIANLPAGHGLNAYLRQHAGLVSEVEVPSPEVLEDLDTPEDYERLLSRWAQRVISS